jgi:Fic family protein
LRETPADWLHYDRASVLPELTAAKAAMLALTEIPYQRSWGDELQKIQLKRAVAGTSRIEGAGFTEKELDAAIRESAEQLETRSQRQPAAALAAYRWIAALLADRSIDEALIREVHRRIVAGCDRSLRPPPLSAQASDDRATRADPEPAPR